ncbi:MAG: adenylate/guanylate cyclase domain-containing protein [Candidatus Cybelea sp.]
MATRVKPGPPALARPTGTVTFLFSDIEGSTVRWDRGWAAMQDAVRRHDALMRTAIAEHDGYVFKTIGDAFCAAFARPQDAVAAILDAQRGLATEDFSSIDGLRVRAAVHTGTADERGGDYFGPALNRVARLLAIGHGGQVLVSGVTTDLVQGALPARASLRDLGEHRLRDLARPEQVYQLLAPDLADDFPPLRSLDVLPNNLPLQLTTFVGREVEIGAIAALIEQHRLVTLVGSGGVGKTRLSLQVAASLLDDSGDGVWFIELAPLTSGDYIPSTVALALGLTLAPEGDPVENLVRELKGKHALLVFDNCEHLVEPAARVISAILHGCPKVKVVASSRQGLGVAGEATYQVPSLDLPSKDDAHPTAIDSLHYESVALFVERAGVASATFSITDENAPIVADICRRLDGIPLAIELAAARVKMLTARQLCERLDERFRLLTGGSRDVSPRQQTLRALIDWSYDLLDERERVVFRRLGIFVSGFTLEGAVAVGRGEDLDELDVFDVLASLVDKSLVLAEPQGDAVRYRLLESIRAYALEKLDDSGERDLVAGRHLRYLRDRFAELRAHGDRTARAADLDAALQTELDDVRAALDGAFARLEVVEGGELLANIYATWQAIGLDAEGMARCEAYLAALTADQSQLRARLSAALSYLLVNTGQKVRGFELAAEAVGDARASGDASLLARVLCQYGCMAVSVQRPDDAESALIEAEGIAGTSAYLRIQLLEARAFLSWFRGDLEMAARTYERLRNEHRKLGNTRMEHMSALNLAEIEHARGQTQLAIGIVRETLAAARVSAHEGTLAILLENLAAYLAAVDDLPGADAAAREAIGIRAAREPDDAHNAIAIDHLALVFALHGNHTLAARLEGYADNALQRHGYIREFTETTTHDRLTALLREGLTLEELARLIAEGAALTPEAAIALALEEDESAQE